MLLDTHTFFWAVRDPSLLSVASRDALLDTEAELLVSQAQAERAALVTRDRAMSTAPGVTLLW